MRLKDICRFSVFMLQVSMTKGKVSRAMSKAKKLQWLEQEEKLKKRLQEQQKSRLHRAEARNLVRELAGTRPILFGSYLASTLFFSNLKQCTDRIYKPPKMDQKWTSEQLYRHIGLNVFDAFTWIISLIFEQYFLFQLIKDLHEKEIILELLSKDPSFYEQNNNLLISSVADVPEKAADLVKDYISFIDKVIYLALSSVITVTDPDFKKSNIFHAILLICGGAFPVVAQIFMPWLNPNWGYSFSELLENRSLIELSGNRELEARVLKERILRSEYAQRVNQVITHIINVIPSILTVVYYVYYFVEWPTGDIDMGKYNMFALMLSDLSNIFRFLGQFRGLSKLILYLNSDEGRLGRKLELLYAERSPEPNVDAPAFCSNGGAKIEIEFIEPFIYPDKASDNSF